MDFKTQGEEKVYRKQNAWTGFQQTIQLRKMYSEENMKIKSIWLKEIEAAKDACRINKYVWFDKDYDNEPQIFS